MESATHSDFHHHCSQVTHQSFESYLWMALRFPWASTVFKNLTFLRIDCIEIHDGLSGLDCRVEAQRLLEIIRDCPNLVSLTLEDAGPSSPTPERALCSSRCGGLESGCPIPCHYPAKCLKGLDSLALIPRWSPDAQASVSFPFTCLSVHK